MRKISITVVIFATFLSVCLAQNTTETTEKKNTGPDLTQWRAINDKDSALQKPEETLAGILRHQSCVDDFVRRCNRYLLNGQELFVGKHDLDAYLGNQVEIVGQRNLVCVESGCNREIYVLKVRQLAVIPQKTKTDANTGGAKKDKEKKKRLL